MNKEVEKIFVDILKTKLSLDDENVVIGFQDINLGSIKTTQIAIQNIDSQIISNNNYLDAENETETSQVVMRENIQIDIFSKDTSARQYRWKILAALQSYYSLSKQEEYQFKIFSKPVSFVNTSFAEGGSNLNRFTAVVPCHVWYSQEEEFKDIYTSFPARIDDENTIDSDEGMIEFDI